MKKIFFPIICLAVALFIFAFLWKVPEWQIDSSKGSFTPKERIELENNARRTWAQILGGVFFLITAYFTWRRVTATERNVLIAQEGQITERFTRAIEQLGDEGHLEVRLGGIYALERIARDSKKDHWTIMEILIAYVRANAPWRGKADEAEEKRKGEEGESRDSEQLSPTTNEIRPPADIQAILTVLARRTLEHEEGENRKLELSETDLGGVNIGSGSLDKAILVRANLQEAHLGRANLQEAYLPEANLQGANLMGANLQEAHLVGANLQGAYLVGVNLQEAYLNSAKLQGANLVEANLQKVSLWRANLQKADLSEANLQEAGLLEANLQGANLMGANLQKAGLLEANLQEADLMRAIMKGVEGLTCEQLSKVITLYEAKLDPELMDQIKEKYPHLLEKPKED